MTFDISNLGMIYQGETGFNYSLPRAVLEQQLDGTAFGRNIKYTEDEQDRVLIDMKDLAEKVFKGLENSEKKRAIISAGAPGAGKTTVMRARLKEESVLVGYSDPDDVCLLGMKQTFLADIQKGLEDIEAQQLPSEARIQAIADMRLAAYTKWRPASNGIHNLLLAHLIRLEAPFYFGTTASAPQTGLFFKFLKSQGYEVNLVHVSAPDQVRLESIRQRNESFVQVTETDVREKGEMVPQRLLDTYIAYGDTISFYYRSDAKAEAVLAAVWTRISEADLSAEPSSSLKIIDERAFDLLKSNHDEIYRRIGKIDLLWDTCMRRTQVEES